jgi:hypothetical protein
MQEATGGQTTGSAHKRAVLCVFLREMLAVPEILKKESLKTFRGLTLSIFGCGQAHMVANLINIVLQIEDRYTQSMALTYAAVVHMAFTIQQDVAAVECVLDALHTRVNSDTSYTYMSMLYSVQRRIRAGVRRARRRQCTVMCRESENNLKRFAMFIARVVASMLRVSPMVIDFKQILVLIGTLCRLDYISSEVVSLVRDQSNIACMTMPEEQELKRRISGVGGMIRAMYDRDSDSEDDHNDNFSPPYNLADHAEGVLEGMCAFFERHDPAHVEACVTACRLGLMA